MTEKGKPPTLISTSILYSGEHDVAFDLSFTKRIEAALRAEFADDPFVEVTGCFAFHDFNEDYSNARRCEKCGRWATDYEKPDAIDALRNGSVIPDRGFLCLECNRFGAT